ncbi:MAG: FAD-binding oxidoreductase [Pseudomonadota bacterium]
MQHTEQPPLWRDTSGEPDHTAPFSCSADVDLAVVGGGYTGLSTALHAAERGMSVHLIEAGEIGAGASGRNVGLVNAGVWQPPDAVIRALGPDRADRFLRVFGEAPAEVFELVERHQIRCAPTRTGTIHAAHAPAGLRTLRARHRAWAERGAPVEVLSREEVCAATGSVAYAGGLLDHRAGTVDPMGYVRGLARAALGAGATISTGTRVTGLTRAGGRWAVAAPDGILHTRAVVLATNAYTDALWPGLAQCYTPISYFQLSTEPLGARIEGILPRGQGLWDTGRIMVSLRRAGDRLIIGSMGRVMGDARRGLSRRWAARQLARHFPDLGLVNFEQAWHGAIAMTPDNLPRLCRLAPDLYTAIGYNGRGITTGTVFGRALAGLAAGEDEAGLPLPLSDPLPVAGRRLRAMALDAAFVINQAARAL